MSAGNLKRSIQALHAHAALLELRAAAPGSDTETLLQLALEDLQLALATITTLAQQPSPGLEQDDDLGSARLRRLAGAVEAVHLTDGQGRLLAANPAAVRLLGYSSFEELRAGVPDAAGLYLEPQFDVLLACLDEAAGLHIHSYEGLLRTRAGRPLRVHCQVRRVHDSAGEILGVDVLWQPLEGGVSSPAGSQPG